MAEEQDREELIQHLQERISSMSPSDDPVAERMQRELDRARQHVDELSRKITDLKLGGLVAEIERTLQDTLVTIRKLTDEMTVSARRESELAIREARMASEKLLAEVRGEEARLSSEVKMLRRARRQLVEDLRATLAQYQRLFSGELVVDDGDDEGG
jgi:DivIVA protein